MMRVLRNRQGQSQAVEYAIVIFLIVGALAAMSTYIKRASQARIYDTRNFAFQKVNEFYTEMYNGEKTISPGYEPYYVQKDAIKSDYSSTIEQQLPLAGAEGVFQTGYSSSSAVTSSSVTAPPVNAQ